MRQMINNRNDYGITVNCVAPGPTQTGWIDPEFEKQDIPIIPMGRRTCIVRRNTEDKKKSHNLKL